MSQFGVLKDLEGNLLAPVTNVEGVEVGNSMLAHWIWQGCKYMKEDFDVCSDDCRANYLKSTIYNALTIYYKLLLCDDDEIQEHIDRFFGLVARRGPNYKPNTDEFTPKEVGSKMS